MRSLENELGLSNLWAQVYAPSSASLGRRHDVTACTRECVVRGRRHDPEERRMILEQVREARVAGVRLGPCFEVIEMYGFDEARRDMRGRSA